MRRHQKSAFYCQLQCQGCAGWVNRRRVMWTCSSACQHEQHHCDPGSPLLVLLKRDQKDWQGQDTAQDNYSLGCSLWKNNAISLESSFFCVKALWLVDGCSFMQKLSLSGRTVLMGTMVGAAELWYLPTEMATGGNIHFSVHEMLQYHLMASHAQNCVPCTCHRSWVWWLTLQWLHHSSVSLHKGDFLMFFFTNHNSLQLFQFFLQSFQLHLHQCRVRAAPAVLWLRRVKQLWCSVPHCDPALWVLRNAQTDQ